MIQVCSNYDYSKQIYEHSDNPSACIPNQAYSAKDLVVRYSCGTMPNIKRVGTWDTEPNIDTPNPLNDPNLDLVDIQRLKSKNISRINDLLKPQENADEIQEENKTSTTSNTLDELHE